MTSSRTPDPLPPDPLPPDPLPPGLLPPDPVPLRVGDPGELIAAVPPLIGFHPRDSLVLVATGGESGRRLGLTLRIDLPEPGHLPGVPAEIAASAVRGLLLDDPAGAAVIVVGGSPVPDVGPDRLHLPWRGLADLVVGDLERCGVEVHTLLWAQSTAAGARWACYDPCGCHGTLPDPGATSFAAAAVANGQVVHADRAALRQLVTPPDPERIRRREALLLRTLDAAAGAPAAGDPAAGDPAAGDPAAGDPAAGDPAVLGPGAVDAAIADAAADRLVLDDERVVALACALADPALRDGALLRSVGPDAAAAEQLWTALVRETPDPEAAEPAALLAASALLRGDGALANVALDRAHQAWPGHRLTALLRAVADAGLRPAQVRHCLLGSPGGSPAGSAGRDHGPGVAC